MSEATTVSVLPVIETLVAESDGVRGAPGFGLGLAWLRPTWMPWAMPMIVLSRMRTSRALAPATTIPWAAGIGRANQRRVRLPHHEARSGNWKRTFEFRRISSAA